MEINQLIISKLSKGNKSLLNAEIKEENLSSRKIKKQIVKKHSNDFFEIAKIYLKNIEERKKIHQLDIEIKRVKVFKDYVNNDKLFFNALYVELLLKFQHFLF